MTDWPQGAAYEPPSPFSVDKPRLLLALVLIRRLPINDWGMGVQKRRLPVNAVQRWMNWQVGKVLPDPGRSFQRIEPDRVIFEEITWHSHERVLDVGCYRGDYASQVADRVRSVVGLDVSATALQEMTDARIKPICADGQTLPFVDESFDTILCHMTANLFDVPQRAVAEFVRCTKPGGRIILSLCNLDAPYQRVNSALEQLWPDCSWATLRSSRNRWDEHQWSEAMASSGAPCVQTYSCNLCWPLVHRIRGRWIIPNRVMFGWSRTIRRLSGLALQTKTPHFAAHDYVLIFSKADRQISHCKN